MRRPLLQDKCVYTKVTGKNVSINKVLRNIHRSSKISLYNPIFKLKNVCNLFSSRKFQVCHEKKVKSAVKPINLCSNYWLETCGWPRIVRIGTKAHNSGYHIRLGTVQIWCHQFLGCFGLPPPQKSSFDITNPITQSIK